MEIKYNAEPTLAKFHSSNARRRFVIGPVGSGKSTGMCMEIMSRAMRQKPGPDGLRRTRWAVVRNTYRELKDTTLKTWLDWFPEYAFGRMHWQDMEHRIKFNDVRLEVLFRALDRPDDVKKLLSLELTGAWFNECREVPKSIVEAMDDRVGRFPAVKDKGCTWEGLIGDTNPPDEDHWLYTLAEEVRPRGWKFFKQPGGLIERDGQFYPNPKAENLKNLPKDYYVVRMAGKNLDHVRVYYCAQYGFVLDGKPVYPEYADATHCSHEVLKPLPGRTLVVGMDFGLTPAATFAQRLDFGRWQVIDEIVTEDMGATNFAKLVVRFINEHYREFENNIEFWGDPSGDSRGNDEETTFRLLRANGINANPAPSNDFTIRREAVAEPLSRMVDGKPGLILSPKCKVLRKGMAGAYSYKRVQVSGQERYHDKPDKNKYSHVCEALQYGMLGAGEGRRLTSATPKRTGPRQTSTRTLQEAAL